MNENKRPINEMSLRERKDAVLQSQGFTERRRSRMLGRRALVTGATVGVLAIGNLSADEGGAPDGWTENQVEDANYWIKNGDVKPATEQQLPENPADLTIKIETPPQP